MEITNFQAIRAIFLSHLVCSHLEVYYRLALVIPLSLILRNATIIFFPFTLYGKCVTKLCPS